MPRKLHEGVSPAWPLATIAIPTHRDFDDISVTQHAARALTSYDIHATEAGVETFVVPGSLPVFAPPAFPLSLPPDAPTPAVAEAFPRCPLEPLLRALAITAPDVDPASFDVVTDRRNLRLLLDFATDRTREFRLNAQIVDGTLLLARWIDWEQRAATVVGAGKNWEHACTRRRGEQLAHKRAVGYSLGGLRMCVSSMINARLPGDDDDDDDDDASGKEEGDGDERAAPEATITPTGHRLIRAGSFAPQSVMVQIKSCSQRASQRVVLSRALPQMWFSRTQQLCTGQHINGGVFVSLALADLDADGAFADWQRDNSGHLKTLVKTLYELKTTLTRLALPSDACATFAVICRTGRGTGVATKLQVYGLARDYGFGLPDDLVDALRGTRDSAAAPAADADAALHAAMEKLDLREPSVPLRRGLKRAP